MQDVQPAHHPVPKRALWPMPRLRTARSPKAGLGALPQTVRDLVLIVACLIVTGSAAAEPVHGIAMHGNPKYPPGFSHFRYVNPAAPKGGRLVLGTLGIFDSLNPFIIKGVTPPNLRDLV